MSGFRSKAVEWMTDRPRLLTAAWLLALLLVEVGTVVADGGSSGP